MHIYRGTTELDGEEAEVTPAPPVPPNSYGARGGERKQGERT